MIPEQTLLGFPLFGDNATKVEPDNNKKSNGWQQGDVVPAEWMNWEWYHASKGVADLNKGVNSMEKEINSVLSSFGITAAELTNNQLLTAMRMNASFVTATGTTITGPLLINNGTIRVMFTQDIAGSDTTTGLTISYNGQSIPVKVAKNGALIDFVAREISTGSYKYLQAYTMLELFYDGVNFIIVGNPVVLSSSEYTIHANGINDIPVLILDKSISSTSTHEWEVENLLNFKYLFIRLFTSSSTVDTISLCMKAFPANSTSTQGIYGYLVSGSAQKGYHIDFMDTYTKVNFEVSNIGTANYGIRIYGLK